MKKTKRILLYLVCIVLITAIALTITSCGEKTGANSNDPGQQSTSNVVGEGKVSFDLKVVDMDGNETSFKVKTDEKTVGQALLKEGLISGDDSDYGLYVKTVNGITADYDKDKTYWAFYINGEYASTGVDATDVTEGAVYSFKIQK